MALPAWLSTANVDEWIVVPATASLPTAMSGIEAAYPGTGDVQSQVESWSRGLVVYIGGEPYLACRSGGHLDGAWNGILAFGPLTSDAPTWQIIANSASAVADVIANSNYYADGRPAADHGYGLGVYLPDQNQLLLAGLAAGYGGSAIDYRTFDAFDFGSGSWDVSSYDNSPAIGSNQQGVAVWDPVNSRVLYYLGKSSYPYDALRAFDPIATPGGQHTSVSAGGGAGPYQPASALAFDTSRGHAMFLDNYSDTFKLFDDIGNTSVGPATITLSGDTGITTLGRVGLIYNPDIDRYIAYRDDVGDTKSIYIIDPTPYDSGGSLNWTATKVTPSGGATPVPGSQDGTGIYNRFQYIANADFGGYVMFSDYNGDVMFWPTYINATTEVSNSIELQWSTEAYVSNSVEIQWQSLQYAQNAVELQWSAEAYVSNSVELQWQILALTLVSNSIELQWPVLSYISKGVELQWPVVAYVQNNIELQWSAEAYVSNSIELQWQIGEPARVAQISIRPLRRRIKIQYLGG